MNNKQIDTQNEQNLNSHLLMNQEECEQVSKILGLTPIVQTQQVLNDETDEIIIKKFTQLTQHKKNLYLLESSRNGSLDDVLKIIQAGADLLAQERAYPNYTALDLAIIHGKNPQLTFFLFSQNAPLKRQFINKKIISIDSNNQPTTTTTLQVDYSADFWKIKWEQCLTHFSAQQIGELIDNVSNSNEPWATHCKKFMPQKNTLLSLYAKENKWIDARDAMVLFGGKLTTEDWHKCFGYNNLNYTFTNYSANMPRAIDKRSAISEIILANKHNIDAKTSEELYSLAIINDADDLFKTMLKTFVKPNDDWTIPIGAQSFFARNNSNNIPKKENLLVVALQRNSEKCLKILWGIPSILNKLKDSTINPENICNIKVTDLQKIEEIGANINSTDKDGKNFLHHYAEKTNESVVGWTTLARWKSDLLNSPNNDNETPIDIMTKRIKSLDRRLVSYNEQADNILSAFQKTVARAEATVLRKELKSIPAKNRNKKISTKTKSL